LKKRILTLSMVLALVTAMVMPMAAFAADDTTSVSGTIAATIEVQAPSSISLGQLNQTVDRTGSSGTPGNVYATAAWGLAVTASNGTDDVYGTVEEIFAWMTLDNAGTTELTNPLGIGTTAASIADLTVSLVVGSIADYQTQIEALDTYGTDVDGVWALPLYVEQIAVASDTTVGTYSVVLTYTGTLS